MEGVNLVCFLLLLGAISDGFSCVQISAMNSGIHCTESEKIALIKFRQGFRNPLQSMSSWMLEENCCKWKGVECDNKTGHVIALDLHKQFLQGEFATSLLGLPHLRHLDLSQIDFLGAQVPEFISTFKNLEYLNLSKNKFRGTIPEHLGNLSRLQFLDLSDGFSLRVDNLQWIRHLFSMKILDLSGVDMSDAKNWLHDINLLTSLTELHMSACQLDQLLPSNSFMNLTSSLRIFDLSLNHFQAPIPSWLFNTSHSLVYLNLTRSQVRGLLPNAFGNMYSLRVVDLSDNSLLGNLPPTFVNMSSVTFLDISRKSLEGNLPPALSSKLKILDLSNNNMEGPLARSIAQLRQLVVLDVSWNSFNDSITDHFLNFSNLQVLDLSSNSIILNLTATWMPRFQLDFIGLQSCQLSTHFPLWLQTQKEFSFVDISGAELSGKVPEWFWNLSAKVKHMNISNNYFRGEVPEVTERLTSLEELDLSWNNFDGPLPHFSPTMMTLILDHNSFNGTLSDCWRYGKNLAVLNLARNDLSGEVPHSIGYLTTLRWNKFEGNIPLEICQLKSLIILDLSSNALSGTIPKCVGNFLTLAGVEEVPSLIYGPFEVYREDVMMMLKERGYDHRAHFFLGIDLSENHLSGEIPGEITTLVQLRFLNLSWNNLTGAIPHDISNLHNLEALDVSRNALSCFLPSNMVKLDYLAIANFSYNRLTGKIPTGNQFATFSTDCYIGNPDLCGVPVSQGCSGHFHEDITHCNSNSPRKQEVDATQSNENNWLDESSFYISMGIGFITTFWVFWTTLLLKKSWRYAYMRYLDNMANKIYK
ncbi:receptor-like protein EIX2 isoform X3 [Nicotiana tabacum]|uniref:Receptor-like protein EIX2 isoform X3 n=1 Tax=Nicotiana tabacum TaxID=4097 RepID=A0AC58SHG4_TOBAC